MSVRVSVCQELSSAETVCTGGSDGDCYPCHIPLDDICTCVCVSVDVGGSCQHQPPRVHSHPGPKAASVSRRNTNTRPAEVTGNNTQKWMRWLTQRQLETYSQDSWSKLGVFISFQKRRVSSFITWSTAARRRRCRRRQKHWRHTSLSWRLRYTMIPVTPTIEKWSRFKFCKRAPSLRSPHTFSSTQVMILVALFKYNLY